MNYKSILEPIAEEVFISKDLCSAKIIFIQRVEQSKIKEKDKKIMLIAIEQCKTLMRLQIYLANALLRFEGMSLNSYKDK